jgi:hypothetical protein
LTFLMSEFPNYDETFPRSSWSHCICILSSVSWF